MVFEILGKGAESAITGKRICGLLNITARDLTVTIARERRQGRPICASTGRNPGYYLAETKEEMQDYCNSLLRRVDEIDKTRLACMEAAQGLPGIE